MVSGNGDVTHQPIHVESEVNDWPRTHLLAFSDTRLDYLLLPAHPSVDFFIQALASQLYRSMPGGEDFA